MHGLDETLSELISRQREPNFLRSPGQFLFGLLDCSLFLSPVNFVAGGPDGGEDRGQRDIGFRLARAVVGSELEHVDKGLGRFAGRLANGSAGAGEKECGVSAQSPGRVVAAAVVLERSSDAVEIKSALTNVSIRRVQG